MNNKLQIKIDCDLKFYKKNYLILKLNKKKNLYIYIQYLNILNKKKFPFISIRNNVYYYYFENNNFLNLLKFLNFNKEIIKVIGFIFNGIYINVINIYMENIYNNNMNIYIFFLILF